MRTLFAFFFLALLAFMGGVAVFVYFTKDRSANVKADVPVVRSFAELYPFEDEANIVVREKTGFNGSAVCRKISMQLWTYQDFVQRWTSGISRYTSGRNLLYNFFWRVVGVYDRIVENDLVERGGSAILRLDNGYYTLLFPYSDSVQTWDNIRDFAGWLRERNIRCVHLLPPYKFDDRVTVFPDGIPHGYARMVAEYQQFLSDNGIPCIDATSVLLAENPNSSDWFYKVSNFHMAHVALTIAYATAQKLNNELAVAADIEAARAENFTRTVYTRILQAPPWAQGRDAVGEDFEMLYPKAGGRFHVEVPSLGIDRVGEFSNTIIAQCSLHSTCSQMAFLYGFPPLIQVENLICPNSTRVLVIRRCDMGSICSYLASTVRRLDVIFPPNFDGSIRTFIEKTKPDVVIFCTYMQTSADGPFWRLK